MPARERHARTTTDRPTARAKPGFWVLLAAATLVLAASGVAYGEGSYQIGLNQYLYDYDHSYSSIPDIDRPLFVDIVASGEIINISLCGRDTNTDDLSVEIIAPDMGVTTYYITEPTDPGHVAFNAPFDGPLTNPIRYDTSVDGSGVGTYEIRLHNDEVDDDSSSPGVGSVLWRYDITVTPNVSVDPDPRDAGGRLHAYSWAFTAGGFALPQATSGDYYALVPGGRPGTDYVWYLDLEDFAGYVYDIIANDLGANTPYSGYSIPTATGTTTPKFPVYLAYPVVANAPPEVPPVIGDVHFIDDDGVDISITPNGDGVQDAGTFEFTSDVEGTYAITIDTNQDGEFGTGDRLLLGNTIVGPNSVYWDGTDSSGTVVPLGTYDVQIQIRLGEYHFVASDVETSGGGTQDGLTICEMSPSQVISTETMVYWDDATYLSGTTTLPNGEPCGTAAARHTWGDFSGTSLGNNSYIDTYVFGRTTLATASVVVADVDDPLNCPTVDLDGDDSSGAGGSDYWATFSIGGPAVPISDTDPAIVDDGGTLEWLECTLTNAQTGDSIYVDGSLPPAISLDGSSTTSYVLLTGTASVADYMSALQLVAFDNSEADPDTMDRVVTVVADDGNCSSNTAICSIAFQAAPAGADLFVTKIVDDTTPAEGDTITYTITVTNNGPQQATNVAVTDVLPAGVTYLDDDGGGDYVDGTGVWTVGTINSGASEALDIRATVDVGEGGSVITNTITDLSLDQSDTDVTPDDLTEVITVDNEADVFVGKTVDDTTPAEGDTVTYTITVTNDGPARATGVTVTDLLPGGVTYLDDDGGGDYVDGTGLWTVGTLDAGTGATLHIRAVVDAGTAGSVVTNTITDVSLDQTDPGTTPDDPSEDITVDDETDLFVGKTVDDATPAEGDTLTYTITVTNNGPARATSVVITDVLPTGVTYVDDDGAGDYVDGTGVWSVGTLDAGTGATLNIRAVVDSGTGGTVVTNTITDVSLDQTDSDDTPDDLTEDVSVDNWTDLFVGKTVDDASPAEGDTVTFSITVTNNGPLAATGVSVTDVLPVGMTYVDDDGGGDYVSATGVWTIGSLGIGATVQLDIRATVDAGSSGSSIVNTITDVSLDQTDSDATPDDLTEIVSVDNDTDLFVGKTVDDVSPAEGDTVTYAITVTNNGPVAATSVSVTDPLPAGVTYVSDDGGGDYDDASGLWSIGALSIGQSVVLHIQATVDAGTAGSTIMNLVVNVSSDQTDTDETEDDLEEEIEVENETDIVVAKTVDDSTPLPGDNIVYTITVTNNGPATATNLAVTDQLPLGVTYVSDDGGGDYDYVSGLWTIGTLDAEESVSLNITVNVNEGTEGTTITNTVTDVILDQEDSNHTTDDPSEDINVASDFDGDGVSDADDLDDDNDGILDTDEGDGEVDSDGDGNPDSLDIDADNDGIVDNVEGQTDDGYVPPSGSDSDGDGLDDAYDTDSGGSPIVPIDTDGDGTDDYLDLDSDDDNVPDAIEGHDDNHDGVADTVPSGSDSDNDGLDDAYDTIVGPGPGNEVGSNSPLQDTNDDGERDWRDIDDDGDGIPTGGGEDANGDDDPTNDDSDGDGHPDYLDTDQTLDSDGDGIIDAIDIDDDNDGILDVDEGDGEIDSDGDGVPDSLDIDADNDGIVDNVESQEEGSYVPPTGTDTDGDGLDDAYDTDNGGTPVVPVDTDGDGTDDYLDLDSDDDGVPDSTEGHDANHDGHPDTVPSGSDSDYDGLDDAYDTVVGPGTGNETGSSSPLQDTDGDEIRDWRDVDDDDDGIPTEDEDGNENGDFADDDWDEDGIPDYLDPDQIVEGSILLSKEALSDHVSTGGTVRYSLTAENTSNVAATDVTFRDHLPAGFHLVSGSVALVRAGWDGQIGTADDVVDTIRVSGDRTLTFGPTDLAGQETIRITYLLRVGSGALPGEYTNVAVPYSDDEPAGNTASAVVTVSADPLFDSTTIMGKVFHDRDGDGWQDPAGATGVVVSTPGEFDPFVSGTTTMDRGDGPESLDSMSPLKSGIEIGDLPARMEHGRNAAAVTVRASITNGRVPPVVVTTNEGTKITVAEDGTVTTAHTGAVADGLNGQDIVVTRKIVSAGDVVADGEWVEQERTVVEVDTVKLKDVVEPVRFRSGKSQIDVRFIYTLREAMRALGQKDNIRLHVVGHTDNQPLSDSGEALYGDNYGLGLQRANEVAVLLTEALGLRRGAASASSKGPDEPVASNDTPEGMALNRRVEIQIWYDETVENVRRVTDEVFIAGEGKISGGRELVITISNAANCEEGIAGVRLATPEGLVVETDAFGRYHLADVDGGRFDRGRMLAIKADAAYLPDGTAFTTENPAVLRVTPGVTERVDFGVSLPEGFGGFVYAQGDDMAGVSMNAGLELPSGDKLLALDAIDEHENPWKPGLRMLPDDYFFLVGLASVTAGQNTVSGSLETLSGDSNYEDGELFTDGRIAFYLKTRVANRFLVTAQMDTEEDALENLFDDLQRTDPRSMFRRLDPDRYYPVYGDDSVTFLDTDSQGRFYARVDWDESQVLWGNYNTGLTGTEYGRYNRSLYGAMGHFASVSETERGDSRVELTGFASEATTAAVHAEFEATGGSLYYLRDTDIVQGSEKLWVEIRDRDSGRVVENITLERGRDYELDEIQGRVILSRPLTQVADQAGPSIIKDVPLDGNRVYLIVDYEYLPDGFESDDLTSGGRGKVWLTDAIAVGGTYVKEGGTGTDYELMAADVTLVSGEGTYLKAEYASSESEQSGEAYVSTDGGLDFSEFAYVARRMVDTQKSGDATSFEGRVNITDLSGGSIDGAIAAWWKQRDAGFSVSRLPVGVETIEYGGEGVARLTDALSVSARGAVAERSLAGTTELYSAQVDYDITDRLSVAVEGRSNTFTRDSGPTTRSAMGGARLSFDVTRDVTTYASGQYTVDRSNDETDNSLGTIGVRGRLGARLSVRAEASSGDRGTGANLGADYAIDDLHTMYGTYTLSADHTGGEDGVFTVGQRRTVSDQLRVFTEHQFAHSDDVSRMAQVYGLDYAMTEWTTVGVSVQSSGSDGHANVVERDVASVSASYGRGGTRAGTRLEYRRDGGASETEQWLTTNSLSHRVTPALALQGKFSLSRTTDTDADAVGGKFVEAGAGFAYRPVCANRTNVLGRYTYLYDLAGLSQNAGAITDERSHVVALEGIHAVGHRLDVGGKLARKMGEVRVDRDEGEWFTTTVDFAAARARYHMTGEWSGLLEYRWLRVDEADDTRQGALAAVYRQISGNLRIGAGYNFTDFSDDLTNLSYESQGWFIDLVGSY